MRTSPDDECRQAHLPSYAEFYRTAYGQVITSLRPAGRIGATLLEAAQPAGDWSDAATPELFICQLMTPSVPISLDLGAGRFAGRMATHDFIVAPPRVASQVLVDAQHQIRVLAMPWARMLAWADGDAQALPADGDFSVLHQAFNDDPRLTRALDRLWRNDDGTSAAGTLFTHALLLEIVATIADLSRPARTQPVAGLTRRDLRRIDEFMRARLAEDIGVTDLALLTGLSVAHFCRAFKHATGGTPYQALVGLRMQRARQLLDDTPLSIVQVALACGYGQPSHFAKLFRRATGCAPAQWRRQRLA